MARLPDAKTLEFIHSVDVVFSPQDWQHTAQCKCGKSRKARHLDVVFSPKDWEPSAQGKGQRPAALGPDATTYYFQPNGLTATSGCTNDRGRSQPFGLHLPHAL